MRLNRIKIDSFRNLQPAEVEFAAGPNVLVGRNGAGKSNLLEALVVLLLGRSQRGANDANMVPSGEKHYRVAGEVETGSGIRSQAVAYESTGRKRATIDEVGVRLSELYQDVGVVSLGPEDTVILSGGPAARRTFLDLHLSQMSNDYVSQLQDYSRAVSQKNAALRAESDPGPFEDLMVRHGAVILCRRRELLEELSQQAAGNYATVADGGILEMQYVPSGLSLGGSFSVEEAGAALEEAMQRLRRREEGAQMALVGPHRDDVVFTIDGRPARTHASQGEWRTAAVALKLAVAGLLGRRGSDPVLMLDEIFAELDQRRSEQLVRTVEGFEQFFLTTTAEPPFDLGAAAARYRIVGGQIERDC